MKYKMTPAVREEMSRLDEKMNRDMNDINDMIEEMTVKLQSVGTISGQNELQNK